MEKNIKIINSFTWFQRLIQIWKNQKIRINLMKFIIIIKVIKINQKKCI